MPYDWTNTDWPLADVDMWADGDEYALVAGTSEGMYIEVDDALGVDVATTSGGVGVVDLVRLPTSELVVVGTDGAALSLAWRDAAGDWTTTSLGWTGDTIDDVSLAATDSGNVGVAWLSDDHVYYAVLPAPV